jgi:phosphocarrier protein HPr
MPKNSKERSSTRTGTVEVVNRHGMHARPVTRFVQLANQFKSAIEVSKGDLTVDGKSVMSMLRLGAECGSALRIVARGSDASEAVAGLTGLVQELGTEKYLQASPEDGTGAQRAGGK